MSDGNYSYASDSSERVADELNILNTWMAQIVETGLPQISAQLAEIWGEQVKRRESDSEFVQTVGKLALVGGDNVNGLGCGVHRRFVCLSQVSALLEAFRKLMSPLISRAAF